MTNYKRTNTDTTRFLLPLVGYSKKELINEEFVNAFIQPADVNEILLVYTEIQELLEKDPLFDRILKEDYYIYYTKVSQITYGLFLTGKYSQLEYSEKLLILDFWKLNKHSKLQNILFPKDFLYESFNFINKGLLYHTKNIWRPLEISKETFTP